MIICSDFDLIFILIWLDDHKVLILTNPTTPLQVTSKWKWLHIVYEIYIITCKSWKLILEKQVTNEKKSHFFDKF